MMNVVQSISTSTWVSGFKTITCSHQECTRWLTHRHLFSHSVGIRMHGGWYCSYGCFASAAVTRIAQLRTSGPTSSNRTSRMPLALILIGRGLLTREQWKQAADQQADAAKDLGETFVTLGFVSEKNVTAARATQWDTPVFSISKGSLAVLVHIPPTLMLLHSMVPLHHVAATNSLLMGFVRGIEYGPLYAIEQVTGCKTQPCFVTPGDFQMQMRVQEQGTVLYEELTFETVQSSTEIVRALCDYGALLDANEVVFARSGEYVWARLKGISGATDILFRVA